MNDAERRDTLARAVALREAGDAGGACALLVPLASRYPDDAEIAHQTAWAHDVLGLEREAVPFYERALAADGLSPQDRLDVYTGLGSTYRVLGEFDAAVSTLRRGLAEFPGDGTLIAFLSMALYNTGAHREAVGSLLGLLTATADDPRIRAYRRAIDAYAADLDALTPPAP